LRIQGEYRENPENLHALHPLGITVLP